MNIDREVIFGTAVEKNPPVFNASDRLIFKERNTSYKFSMSQEMLEKHLLLLGGPGSGKTNIIKQIIALLRSQRETSDDVFIIFDTKGDYFKEFYREDLGDVVIANDTSATSPYRRARGFRIWNIFGEMFAAKEDAEMFAKEMAASLFADRKNQQTPFFTNSAQDVFANLLIHLYRHFRTNYSFLNNYNLVDLIKTKNTDFYKSIFSEQVNPDMLGLNSYFGDGDTPQGLGVFGEMKSMVYSAFAGAFSEAPTNNSFSMREAVRSRGGKAIFVEYDLSKGSVLAPIYRLLIDIALKEALGRTSTSRGHVWFILDELKLLPHCMHLEDGLNLGRSMGISIVAGMQSVNQMYELYGREGGQVICGAFSNIFALPLADYESRNYVRELFGKNMYYYYPHSRNTTEQRPMIREGYTVEDWILNELVQGQSVVGLNGYRPFLFLFDEYRRK